MAYRCTLQRHTLVLQLFKNGWTPKNDISVLGYSRNDWQPDWCLILKRWILSWRVSRTLFHDSANGWQLTALIVNLFYPFYDTGSYNGGHDWWNGERIPTIPWTVSESASVSGGPFLNIPCNSHCSEETGSIILSEHSSLFWFQVKLDCSDVWSSVYQQTDRLQRRSSVLLLPSEPSKQRGRSKASTPCVSGWEALCSLPSSLTLKLDVT